MLTLTYNKGLNMNGISYSPILKDEQPGSFPVVRESPVQMGGIPPGFMRRILARSPEMVSDGKSSSAVPKITLGVSPSAVGLTPSPDPEQKMVSFAEYTRKEEMIPWEKAVIARFHHKHIPQDKR